jgi:hypothetical protein
MKKIINSLFAWVFCGSGIALEVGTMRTISTFLIFPKCIGNECRWWRRVTYREVVKERVDFSETKVIHCDYVAVEWVGE